MNAALKFLFTTTLFLGFIQLGSGQKFLQLEVWNHPETIKFYEGQRIIFKTTEFPEAWQEQMIETILVDDNVLVFPDGLVHLDDITEFKIHNHVARAIGLKLMQFGVVWFGFGGVAAAAYDFDFGWDTFAIGGGAILTGWLLRKLAGSRTYDVTGKDRLRLLDISLPENPYGK